MFGFDVCGDILDPYFSSVRPAEGCTLEDKVGLGQIGENHLQGHHHRHAGECLGVSK
jgi:hypothetical protein